MNRQDFIQALIDHNIDPSTVAFNDGAKEGYGIRKNYLRWEIYFRERGTEFYTRGFPSESDALVALLYDILHYK